VDARRRAKELGVGPDATVLEVLDDLGVKPKGGRAGSASDKKRTKQ
jgi:hypothetical protein